MRDNMNIDELYKKVLNGDILSINNDIIDLYINMHDINKYRLFVDDLENDNCYLKDIIDKKRKEKWHKSS